MNLKDSVYAFGRATVASQCRAGITHSGLNKFLILLMRRSLCIVSTFLSAATA